MTSLLVNDNQSPSGTDDMAEPVRGSGATVVGGDACVGEGRGNLEPGHRNKCGVNVNESSVMLSGGEAFEISESVSCAHRNRGRPRRLVVWPMASLAKLIGIVGGGDLSIHPLAAKFLRLA